MTLSLSFEKLFEVLIMGDGFHRPENVEFRLEDDVVGVHQEKVGVEKAFQAMRAGFASGNFVYGLFVASAPPASSGSIA
jgi:hypothetical protein